MLRFVDTLNVFTRIRRITTIQTASSAYFEEGPLHHVYTCCAALLARTHGGNCLQHEEGDEAHVRQVSRFPPG